MKEDSFVDTNILVCAYDSEAGKKHELAMELMDELWMARNGVLSTRVLCEFFVTITRKILKPVPTDYARQVIEDFASSWRIVVITQDTILNAIDIVEEHAFSFWDALIWSAAKHSGAIRVYTEDLQHGLVIDGVESTNPFLS